MKHKWTLVELELLKKFVEASRCFIVLHRGEQVGYIDDIPPDFEKWSIQFHHGTDGDSEAYSLGDGIEFSDYEPSDFEVKKLIAIDWQTCDFEKELDESLKSEE